MSRASSFEEEARTDVAATDGIKKMFLMEGMCRMFMDWIMKKRIAECRLWCIE